MNDLDKKEVLIEHRLNQAKETILEVDKLVEIGLLHVAVNRIYYGMFYCLQALSLTYNFETTKHLQLIGWFNQNFIKTNQLPLKFGKILRDAYHNRTDSDYAPFTSFSESEVFDMHRDMKIFITELEIFIRSH